MRARTIAVGLLLGLVFLPSTSGARKPPAIRLDSIVGRVDLHSLVPLLEKGELCLVDSDRKGRIKQVSVVGLVKAHPDTVWRVLTDYEHYVKFMPSLAELEIVARKGADVVMEFELEVPGSNLEYTMRHHHVPRSRIEISLENDEGDITSGAWRWELVPCAGGAQTILVYTLYTDVRESSWILEKVIESQPSVEPGLNVATGLITLRAVKKRAESI
ncbi:MAG: SRPBCC family protein [Deltaproteobacteria bacterium]|nr:SRPBCC family protein [Deltaproteobacteria bacterium]